MNGKSTPPSSVLSADHLSLNEIINLPPALVFGQAQSIFEILNYSFLFSPYLAVDNQYLVLEMNCQQLTLLTSDTHQQLSVMTWTTAACIQGLDTLQFIIIDKSIYKCNST